MWRTMIRIMRKFSLWGGMGGGWAVCKGLDCCHHIYFLPQPRNAGIIIYFVLQTRNLRPMENRGPTEDFKIWKGKSLAPSHFHLEAVPLAIRHGTSTPSTELSRLVWPLLQDNEPLLQITQQPCHFEVLLTWKIARRKMTFLRAPFQKTSSVLLISLR